MDSSTMERRIRPKLAVCRTYREEKEQNLKKGQKE